MNAQQRYQNRRTARMLSQEVFEASLPHGLNLCGSQLIYECPSCGGNREWYGEDVKDFDPQMPCGGSERCIP